MLISSNGGTSNLNDSNKKNLPGKWHFALQFRSQESRQLLSLLRKAASSSVGCCRWPPPDMMTNTKEMTNNSASNVKRATSASRKRRLANKWPVERANERHLEKLLAVGESLIYNKHMLCMVKILTYQLVLTVPLIRRLSPTTFTRWHSHNTAIDPIKTEHNGLISWRSQRDWMEMANAILFGFNRRWWQFKPKLGRRRGHPASWFWGQWIGHFDREDLHDLTLFDVILDKQSAKFASFWGVD